MPSTPVNIVGAIIIVVFGFFFATVSSRMVGIIGSSNNPVSGMSIATLLISTLILKATGLVGHDGMIAAISIGTIICVIAAIAGDCSQDLKTGYIVGATPKYQQIGEILGVLISSLVIGGILWILNKSMGFGSKELPAPQAVLMKIIVEGVMSGNLPWNLVFVGSAIAVMIELLGLNVLPFAIGLYLPLNTTLGVMFGGVVRLIVDKIKASKESKKDAETRGTLYSAGLIAGEGIMGIILAIFAIIPFKGKILADAINISDKFALPQEASIVLFVGLCALLYFKAKSAIKKESK